MKKHLIFTLFLLNFHIANGAWRLPITNFPMEDTGAGRQSWKIAEGANGWIYFANNSGLLEFNGSEWRTHHIDNGAIIRAVAVNSRGDIYVGALSEFGCFSPDREGRLTYTNLSEELTKEDDHDIREIWNIHTTTNSTHFRSRREVITLSQHGELNIKGGSGLAISSCVMNDNVYVATANGLYVVTESAQLLLSTNNAIPFHQICSMVGFGDDRLLIATSFDGLYLFENGEFKRYKSSADELLKRYQIFSIDVNDDYIACGTVSHGVILIDRKDDSYTIYDTIGGLHNNTVLCLLFDSGNRLWCGLDNGISCIDTSSPLRHYSSDFGNTFTGYCSLIDGDNIYMGTNQGLIYSTLSETNAPRSDNSSSLKFVANSQGQVWSITQIGKQLYCGHNRGLFQIEKSGSSQSIKPIYADDGVWGVTQIDSVRYLVGTYEGILLMHHDGDKIISISKIEGYNSSSQSITMHTPSQSAFIVDANGLEQVKFDEEYSRASSEIIIPNNSFNIKVLTINDKIVVYTPEEIYELDDKGALHPTNAYDNILDKNTPYLLLEVADNQDIWYITSEGLLFRRTFDPSRGEYSSSSEIFYEDRHLFMPRFSNIKRVDQRYYAINNTYGFSIIDTNSPQNRLESQTPTIIGIYDTANRDSLLVSEAYGVRLPKIELPYSQNSIRIIFGSINAIGENLQYSYMLRGSDNTWSEWSGKGLSTTQNSYNQKEYTNLREGNYCFYLRIRNAYNEISESQVEITITPPWQRSWLMYSIYFLITVAAILYARRQIIHHFAARRRLLEIQNAREIENHKRAYKSKSIEHENNIIRIENDRLESEIKLKSAELSNLLLSRLEKNDIITDVKGNLEKIRVEIVNERNTMATKRISSLNRYLDDKMIDNVDWGTFEKNFDLINNNFAQKIQERYSWMTSNERKLCIYIKMGLQNKEIAPLLNLSVRGVEMLRYRIRKKMELSREVSLYDLFQNM